MQRPSPVAPTRQDLGTYLDIVTGPLGPMAQGHLMTVEIRGVDLIFSQAPKMNMHEVPSFYGSHANGITIWINNLWEKFNMPAYSKPVRIHCKAGSVSDRLVFETTAKCKDFVARYEDDGIPYEIDSPFSCAKTTISVRQSKSLEDREIGKQFAPLWTVFAEQLKIIFPDDARSQVLSIKDRRNSVGKPVFKLAPFGSGQLFTVVAPDLCVPCVSSEVLQRVISQASTANA